MSLVTPKPASRTVKLTVLRLPPAVLYVHDSHPLLEALKVAVSLPAGAKMEIVCGAHDGLAGTLSPPPAKAALSLGAVINAPRYPLGVFSDIEDNRGLAATFELPPPVPHSSALLPGTTTPRLRASCLLLVQSAELPVHGAPYGATAHPPFLPLPCPHQVPGRRPPS
jgi:hypothetical protein